MSDVFVPLAHWFGDTCVGFVDESKALDPPQADDDDSKELDALFSQIRCFRASVAEAADRALVHLLTDIAAEVVARELALAPAAIEQIASRALLRYGCNAPFVIRAHPSDVAALEARYPVVSDGELRSGDLVLEVRDGVIDARLGVRLERVLRSLT